MKECHLRSGICNGELKVRGSKIVLDDLEGKNLSVYLVPPRDSRDRDRDRACRAIDAG